MLQLRSRSLRITDPRPGSQLPSIWKHCPQKARSQSHHDLRYRIKSATKILPILTGFMRKTMDSEVATGSADFTFIYKKIKKLLKSAFEVPTSKIEVGTRNADFDRIWVSHFLSGSRHLGCRLQNSGSRHLQCRLQYRGSRHLQCRLQSSFGTVFLISED